ncbi:MAG: MFS transporter [Legionella sp.]
MNHSWLKSVLPIAAIFSFRMLGLFMLIPVFSVYARNLEAATPKLIGIALGIYGLSQGLLQIPFGILSDRYGRKPLLILGLLFFISGSLVGALTDSIYGMIVARTLQGMGAIGSVLIALLADLTSEQQRTKAMAVIGISIGVSFSLAMIISPLLCSHFGLVGIFYLTGLLASVGLLLVFFVIPTPTGQLLAKIRSAKLACFKQTFMNSHLQKLNISIFFQHMMLTSTFFVIPLLIHQQILLGQLSQQWHFYLPIILLSFFIMTPLLAFAEKNDAIKKMIVTSVSITLISQFFLSFSHQHLFSLWTLVLIYFVAFNLLEASIPSLISKQAPSESRGTAMGIYSTSQFIGIFIGGTMAGYIYYFYGATGIFLTNGLLGLVWLLITRQIEPNR